MTLLTQMCIVVLTIAAVAVAIAAIRLMSRIDYLTRQMENGVEAFRNSMEDLRQTSSEMRTLTRSVDGALQNVREISTGFTRVGNRAMDLASAVVDEVERPVRRALGLFRGVRAGTAAFARRWTHRNGFSSIEGGQSDVRHEQPI